MFLKFTQIENNQKKARETRRLKCDGNSKDDIFQTVHDGNLSFQKFKMKLNKKFMTRSL